MTQPTSGIPAGWYPNPLNVEEVRYWDGLSWTPHVMPKDIPPPTVMEQVPRVEMSVDEAPPAAVQANAEVSSVIIAGDVHPIAAYLFPMIPTGIVGLALIPISLSLMFTGAFGDGLLTLVVYALIVSPFWLIGYLRFKNLSVELTNRNVVASEGVVSKKVSSLQIAKFESSGIERSLLGRILGYAEITYVGTGGTKEHLPPVSNFEEFHTALERQLESNHTR